MIACIAYWLHQVYSISYSVRHLGLPLTAIIMGHCWLSLLNILRQNHLSYDHHASKTCINSYDGSWLISNMSMYRRVYNTFRETSPWGTYPNVLGTWGNYFQFVLELDENKYFSHKTTRIRLMFIFGIEFFGLLFFKKIRNILCLFWWSVDLHCYC